jgi:hypothetical protein
VVPNDDLGRDDGHISADITAMEDFAQKLLADVDNHYAPHADDLANQMLARLPAADAQFNELSAFVSVLEFAQDSCQQNIYNFSNGTHGFAKAAEQVSGLYRGSDAFARARLTDVESALVTAGLLPPAPTGANSPADLPSPAGESSVPFDPSAPSPGSSAPGIPTSPGSAPPPAPPASSPSPWSPPSSSSPGSSPASPSSPWSSPPSSSSAKGSA